MCALVKVRKVTNVKRFAARVWPVYTHSPYVDEVTTIVDAVARDGDAAVMLYERQFGAAAVALKVKRSGNVGAMRYARKHGAAFPATLRVTRAQIRAARSRITDAEFDAIKTISKRLRVAEAATMAGLCPSTLRRDGVTLKRKFAPLESVGCYVPGGAARYPSSAIMSIVPACVAGVPRIVVASPPTIDGEIDALTIVAADHCGATEIYRMGGAQAIAALAYGTQTILPVNKIVGPGGPYVAAAKYVVSPITAIDMIAGPTELGIVADSSANASHIALDLVSQSEHSTDTRCFLATDSPRLAKDVSSLLEQTVDSTSRKLEVSSSLEENAFIAVCKSKNDALRLADILAPEHLQVMTRSPTKDAAHIHSAGMILLGDTPSAASDYALGSNHVLPTDRGGQARGPLSVIDFVKMRVTAHASRAALRDVATHINLLSSAEGLPGHAAAVLGRLK